MGCTFESEINGGERYGMAVRQDQEAKEEIEQII
jgi:hypothetical protein